MLNIIDLKEANNRKLSFNIGIFLICVACCVVCFYSMIGNRYAQVQHLIFEVMGLVVLCLIYFSVTVELYRKLRIFVLDETKKEARLVQLQFLIFFVAYGSKVIVLLCWIQNPPEDRTDYETFLINTDLMALLWTILPASFLLGMQIRSFRKMELTKTQFLHGVEENTELEHPETKKEREIANNSFKSHTSLDSRSRNSAMKLKRGISHMNMMSQGDPSFMDTHSDPGTTSSLENVF